MSDHAVLSDENVGTRVIHGGAQRAVGFVIASLLTAGSAAILLRYLHVDAFGRYGTVLALVGIVYGISDMGLTATGTRELALASTVAERRDVMAHVLGLRIVVTSLGVLAAVAFAIIAGYEGGMVIGTALAGLGVLLQSVQVAMLMPLSVQMRNGALAVNQILTQAALLIGFAVLALIGAGLVPFFAVQILMGVVVLAATPVMLSSADFVAPSWTPSRIRALGAVALPIAVVTVLGVLYLRILVVLMSLISGHPAQLGYYVTSTRVLEVVAGLPFLVVAIVLPVVTVAARDDHQRLVYMTSRVAQVMMLCGVVVALTLWTLSSTIIRVFAGPGYGPAVPVLQIQGFAAITIFLSAAWQPTLMGMHRVRSLVLALSAGVLAVIIGGLVLIPADQAKGAAVAAVIGELTLCASVYIAIRRAGPGQWLPLGPTLRIAAATALALGVGLIPGIATLPRAALVLATFVAGAVVLGSIPSEIWDTARAALGRVR